MAGRKPGPDLETATRAAFESFQESRVRAEAQPRTLTLGDLLRLEQTSEFDVEWLVADKKEDGRQRFLLVPADGGSLVGAGDVELRSTEDLDGRIFRCRLADWVEPETLERSTRTGSLQQEDLEHIRRRHIELGDPDFTGSVLGREAEVDPTYQDWIEDIVMPAHQRLFGASDVQEESDDSAHPGPAHSDSAQTDDSAQTGRSMRYPLIAASVLLAVGLTSGFTYLRNLQRDLDQLAEKVETAETRHQAALDEIRTGHQQEVERLTIERSELELDHQRQLDKVQTEAQQLQTSLRNQIADLEQDLRHSLSKTLLRNPSVAILADFRGTVPVQVPPVSSHVLLALSVTPRDPSSTFRLRLFSLGQEVLLWEQEGLVPSEKGDLWAGFSSGLVTSGTYRLRLDEKRADDRFHYLGDYQIAVEETGTTHPANR